tara:strand:+ start:317 stop:655 length:339 start_codon:yes stop_codon:yes gene_type:complete
MAAKKKQTKAQARRKKLLQVKMEGVKKARKPVDKMIPRLKAGEVAVSVAGLLGPGGVVAGVGKKVVGHLAKRAAKKAAERLAKGATKKKPRLTGESTRKRTVEQLRQPYRKK